MSRSRLSVPIVFVPLILTGRSDFIYAHWQKIRHIHRKPHPEVCKPLQKELSELSLIPKPNVSNRADPNGPQQAAAQNRCPTCARKFRSAHAVSQHSKSALAHAPRKFKCTFCNKKYKSPSGVAHHIESGCHKFTRHHVTAAVRAMDIVPEITAKTIEVSEAPAPTIVAYIATEDMFNGNSYSCSKCPRTFRTLPSLDRHLNSAAHDDNEFRCPKCKAEFTLISGFVQHLESRSCGLSKIKQVENFFYDLADRFSGLLEM